MEGEGKGARVSGGEGKGARGRDIYIMTRPHKSIRAIIIKSGSPLVFTLVYS